MATNGTFQKLTKDLSINSGEKYPLNGSGATHIGVRSGRMAFFKQEGYPTIIFAKSRKHWKFVLIPESADAIDFPIYKDRENGGSRVIEYRYGEIRFFREGAHTNTFCFEKRMFLPS